MSSFYDDASLVVIPSGYKTSKVYAEKPTDGSGDLAFTRTGDTATRVNSAGIIEKVRTNQVRNSTMVGASAPSTLPTNWTLNSAGLTFSVIGTGTEDGLTYVEINASGTASSSNARIGFDSATQILGATGQYWTNSFYFKKVSETAAPDSYAMAIFENTSAGSLVVSNVGSLPATTSLARYSYTVLTAGGATVARVQPFVRFGLTSGNLYNFTFRISATQMEQGDIATQFIPTSTAAVSVGPVANVPRLDYLGSTCPRLLLEPQRTNLVTYSEQLNNAAWGKTNITISANNATSPDGYQNADTCLADGVNAVHIIASNIISFTSGTAYSFSVFAKKGTNNFMQLVISSTVGGMFANFDLNNGTVGTLGTLTGTTPTSSIVDYGNGWYRCVINFTPTATTSAYANFVIVTSASAARAEANTLSTSVILWGAQLEQGAYSTSLIPTLAASATRGADACSKTGISSLIGQTEGTIFVDYNYENKFDSNGSVLIVLTGSGVEAYIFVTGLEVLLAELFYSGLQASIAGSIGAAGRKKIAFAYKQNDFVLYLNGVQIGTDTSGTVGSLTGLFLGSYYTSGYASNTGINQALLFKTRLTNASLAELTSL